MESRETDGHCGTVTSKIGSEINKTTPPSLSVGWRGVYSACHCGVAYE